MDVRKKEKWQKENINVHKDKHKKHIFFCLYVYVHCTFVFTLARKVESILANPLRKPKPNFRDPIISITVFPVHVVSTANILLKILSSNLMKALEILADRIVGHKLRIPSF